MNVSISASLVIVMAALFGCVVAASCSKKGCRRGISTGRVLVGIGVLGVLVFGLAFVFLFVSKPNHRHRPHFLGAERMVMDVERMPQIQQRISKHEIDAVLAPRIQLDADDTRVVRIRVPRPSAPQPPRPSTLRPPMITEEHVHNSVAVSVTAEPAEALEPVPTAEPAAAEASATAEEPAAAEKPAIAASAPVAAVPDEPADSYQSNGSPPDAIETESPAETVAESTATADAAPADTASPATASASAEPAAAGPTATAPADTVVAAADPAETVSEDDAKPASDTAVEAPTKLSVPISKPGPVGGPDWLNQTSDWDDRGIYRMVVVSEPFSTVRECRLQLDKEIMVIFAEFAEEMGGRDQVRSAAHADHRRHRATSVFRDLDLTVGLVRRDALKETFVEDVYSENLGRTMKRVHVLLNADKEVQDDIERRWKEHEMTRKARNAEEALLVICVFGVIFLAILGAIYAILRFDTATKGYYTKRLLLGIGAATILLMFVVFAALANEF